MTKTVMEKIFLRGWRPYVWPAIIIFILYGKVFGFGFIAIDDKLLIVENREFIGELGNFPKLFSQNVFNVPSQNFNDFYYRPVLLASLMLDAQIGGASPFVYHFTNVLLHLLATVLFFIFFTKLKVSREMAFFASLIFAVHPVLTQAVAWVMGRNDSLLAVFILSSFIFLIKYLEEKKWQFYFWHILFFILALFTKETAIIAAVFFGLFYFFQRKEKINPRAGEILITSWFASMIVWFFMRHLALSDAIRPTFSYAFAQFLHNLPLAFYSLGKIVFPVNLAVLPDVKDVSPVFGLLTGILLALLVIFSKRSNLKMLVFGALWFVLFFLPSLVVPVMAGLEHRLYIPLIGFLIMISAMGAVKKHEFNWKSRTAVFLAVIILFAITFKHADSFRDRLSFWESAAKSSPNSYLAHLNLGEAYYSMSFFDKAEAEYKKSLALNPKEPMTHNNLGIIYARSGFYEDAQSEFIKALEIYPDFADAYFNLGLTYWEQNRLGEAERFFIKAVESDQYYLKAYEKLILYYYQKKDLEKARFYFEKLKETGLEISPEILKIGKEIQ